MPAHLAQHAHRLVAVVRRLTIAVFAMFTIVANAVFLDDRSSSLVLAFAFWNLSVSLAQCLPPSERSAAQSSFELETCAASREAVPRSQPPQWL
jgi:hypothetical protein